jgi:ribose transport system substrate-binding protein
MKKQNATHGVLALVGVSCLVLSGCGSGATASSGSSGSGATASSGSSGSGQVGYSESFLTDPFQVQLVKGLGAQAKAQSVDLLPAVNANADAAKQSADVQTLIGRGVKGLIIVPVDSKAIVPAIKQANAQNIPVVTVDLGADSGKIAMIVRANNVYMGKAACTYMGKQLNGKGTVLNLQGDLATTNGQDRSKGFTDCMASDFPGIKIISKPMNWVALQCATQAQTVLSTTSINGIFEGSESVCLTSVQTVLKTQNKAAKVGEPGHIKMVGIDGSPAGLAAIRAGTMDAIISQPLDLYAKYGIQYMKEAMAGKTFQMGPTDHGSTIVKIGDSLEDQLPSPTITKANAADPSLWGNGS